jgi:hypothetical protein
MNLKSTNNKQQPRRMAMKKRMKIFAAVLNGLLCMTLLTITGELMAQSPMSPSAATVSSLVGTWTLTAADNLQPDGSRVHAYGPSPQGILVFESSLISAFR